MALVVSSSGANSATYNAYPPPLAKYEDVVANPKLFMETLEKLHATMKTKFMIPIIGGRDLDLHRLFVEVTSRGGIERILKEKRWKEVTAVFNFPSTATNASFVLRKYYYQLLNHYEQIYFFKAQGWSPLPPGSVQSGAHLLPIAVHGVAKPLLSQVQASSTYHQLPGIRMADSASQAMGAPPVGTPVIGVIDGKFESGYLVTVTIGTEKLKGVLYQVPPMGDTIHQVSQNSGFSPKRAADVPAAPPASKRRKRRKKSEIRKRDPAHPKPNRSGYNFFFAEQHARLKPLYPGRDREISRMIGELWTNLKENEKTVYQEKALKDKERYRREMEGYRERLKKGQMVSDAVPIQQRIPDLDAEMVDVIVKDGTVRDSPAVIFEHEDGEDDDDGDEDDDDDGVGGGGGDNEDEASSVSGGDGETTEKGGVSGDENPNAEKIAAQGIGPTESSSVLLVGAEKSSEGSTALPAAVSNNNDAGAGEENKGGAGGSC